MSYIFPGFWPRRGFPRAAFPRLAWPSLPHRQVTAALTRQLVQQETAQAAADSFLSESINLDIGLATRIGALVSLALSYLLSDQQEATGDASANLEEGRALDKSLQASAEALPALSVSHTRGQQVSSIAQSLSSILKSKELGLTLEADAEVAALVDLLLSYSLLDQRSAIAESNAAIVENRVEQAIQSALSAAISSIDFSSRKFVVFSPSAVVIEAVALSLERNLSALFSGSSIGTSNIALSRGSEEVAAAIVEATGYLQEDKGLDALLSAIAQVGASVDLGAVTYTIEIAEGVLIKVVLICTNARVNPLHSTDAGVEELFSTLLEIIVCSS